MSNLLRLQKSLESGTTPVPVPDVSVRTFNGSDDVDQWLALRSAAFAEFDSAGRPWTAADFHREFTAKPWWQPGHMWFASGVLVPDEPPGAIGSAISVCGTIALARTGRPPHDRASVAWLMVAPAFRKRGIARTLLATLEAAAWDAGERMLTLETHAAWTAAVRLYESVGYARV